MENSTKKSGGVEIPKRKRSLDLKSLYNSKGSEVGPSKNNISAKDHLQDVEKKKRKIRKKVSLSSLESDIQERTDDICGEKSETGSVNKSSGIVRGLHGLPLAFGDNAAVFNIPKRPRGSVGGKKLDTIQLPKPLRISNSYDPVSTINVDVTKSEIESKLVQPLTNSADNNSISKLKSPRSFSRKRQEAVQKPVKLPDSDDPMDIINATVTEAEIDSFPNDKLVKAVTISACDTGISKLKPPHSFGRMKPKTAQGSLRHWDSDNLGPNNFDLTESKTSPTPNGKLVEEVPISAGDRVISPTPQCSFVRKKLKSDQLSKLGLEDSVHRMGTLDVDVVKSVDDSIPKDRPGEVSISAGNDSLPIVKSAGKSGSSNVKPKQKADVKSSLNDSSKCLKLKRKAGEVTDSRNGMSGSVRKEETIDLNNGQNSPKKLRNYIRKKTDRIVGKDSKAGSTNKTEPPAGEERKNGRSAIVGAEESIFASSKPCSPVKRRCKKRKEKNLLVSEDENEASAMKTQPSLRNLGSGCLFVDLLEDEDDDEENLEQNAARMLSSRFDPNCTGFSKKKASISQTADIFSFPTSAARSSFSQQATSSGGLEPANADDKSLALRPRGEEKGKHVPRKRRHFYEIPPKDFDATWIVKRRIKIFWPLDESWYQGLVNEYHPEVKLYHIKYDDRDEEWVDLQEEKFKLLLLPSEVPSNIKRRRRKSADAHDLKEAIESDGDSTGNSLDTEPIASWLARSTERVNFSENSLKKQRLSQMPPVVSSLSSERTENSFSHSNISDSHTARSKSHSNVSDSHTASKPSCDSALLNDDDHFFGTINSSQNGKHIVYVRKNIRKRKARILASVRVQPRRSVTPAPGMSSLVIGKKKTYYRRSVKSGKNLWSIDNKGRLKLNILLAASKEFKFQASSAILAFLELSHGTCVFWLLRNMFMLQHGTMVITSVAVKLEMLFVDSNHGLRFLIFEGCLKQALAFVFLILVVFRQSDEQWDGNMHLPMTSIRFSFFSVQDIRKNMVLAFYSYSGLPSSKWLYLDFKLLQRCLLAKQLHVSECTYDNVEDLDFWSSKQHKTHGAFQHSKYKDTRIYIPEILPTGVSKDVCNTTMSLSTLSLAVKHEKVPKFALSFFAAPTFFLNLHLKLLMEQTVDSANLQPLEALGSTKSSEIDSQPAGGNQIKCDPIPVTVEAISSEPQVPDFRGLSTSRPNSGTELILSSNFIEKVYSSALPYAPVSMDQTSNPMCVSRPGRLILDIPSVDHADDDSRGYASRQASDGGWIVDDGFADSPNFAGSRSSWKHGPSSSISSPLGDVSPVWPKVTHFMRIGFSNGPKKPRTQVQYTMPSAGYDSSSKYNMQNQRVLPCKRIRRASLKKICDVKSSNQKNMELQACSANVLVTQGDKGWRECGAHVLLEVADHNEWKLAVKILGHTKYIHKVKHVLQPGSTNRFSHAMMWKGGQDWILEFPDRSQWMLFKEMHEECYNRNIRAASVRNIPIPGVQLIEEYDDYRAEVPFVRNSIKFFGQVQTDVEMALDPSRVLYDLDSDDEQWFLENRRFTSVSEEFLEKTIDMFEKVSCIQQQDAFTDAEIEDLVSGIGFFEAAKSIYKHWRRKRERKGMPLIRHLQPPLWERYQRQLKEWERSVARGNGSQLSPEKPQMSAFCLKPRGLDVPNRGSKQRSQRKFIVSGQHQHHRPVASGDPDNLVGFARRSNVNLFGDERVSYQSNLHEYPDVSPLLGASVPIDAAHYSMSSDACEWNSNNHRRKKKKAKKVGEAWYQDEHLMMSRPVVTNRNVIEQRKVSTSERRRGDDSDVEELRLREASSASKNALNMARMKRERAQRLLFRADLSVHKAVVALMTADAIQAAHHHIH